MKLDITSAPITVQSSTVDLGDVLPEHARSRILQVAQKYFGRLIRADVHVNREGATFRCSVTIQMGGTKPAIGEAMDEDCYRAFDLALGRAAKQLRRKKRAMREDKATRVDKDMLLRQALGPGSIH
ncbi:MAG TPA: ribosome-associated translation inhibitor RaiA [Microvirga sp.]|jgi:ribosomal subunit interface protein|nr:ribosome-associated translation inhibitor RaiA [Microvirga sp.]